MSKVDLIIQSGSTILYPIVEEGISLSWDRKGSPGKLKFSVVKDSVLSFQEGDAVKLSVDGTDMFYGFVFTKSRSAADAAAMPYPARRITLTMPSACRSF